jgi:hypothetical protein
MRNTIETWRRRKAGAVLHLITGKGKHSSNGPVLRGLVKVLLTGELRWFVADYSLDVDEGGYLVRVR